MNITDLGLQPAFWILPIVFGVALLIALVCILAGIFVGDDIDGLALPIGAFVGVSGLIIGIVWFCVGVPFNATYQHYYKVTGQISTVTNGFSGDGGDITNRVYVVTLGGDKRPYQLEDARVTQLKGQQVTLTCTVAWVDYGNSADQWNCNIRTADFTSEGTR